MRKIILPLLFALVLSCGVALAGDQPIVTQSDDWKYIINNAYRTADNYATKRNPASTFVCLSKNFQFVKQIAGTHKGSYLLMITCKHGGGTSFAVLKPNFDVSTPADKLKDDDPALWKIISAKFNGVEY